MEIPKYYETFVPILKVLSDGRAIRTDALKIGVFDQYYSKLPHELLSQKTKSGDSLILNRISWGKAYLKQAKMISQPERGIVKITNKGMKVLEKGSLSLKELLSDTDFLAHRAEMKAEKDSSTVNENASPQDLVDSGIQSIEIQTKNELLLRLKDVNPYYFQKVILLLLEKMGYGDFVETPKSGDGGIDGIINQDALGLEKIYIQAKRYNENKVREKEIRNFIGAMSGDTSKGIFVTTSFFDELAIKKAHDAHHKIILIDGIKLAELMYKYGVGVQVKNKYEMKQLDEDFFSES